MDVGWIFVKISFKLKLEVTFLVTIIFYQTRISCFLKFLRRKKKVEHCHFKFFSRGLPDFRGFNFSPKKRRKSYFPDLATPDGRLSGRWFRPEPAGSSGCSGFEARPRLLLNDVCGEKMESSVGASLA